MKAADRARSKIGAPVTIIAGRHEINRFSCSSLVVYAYREAGIELVDPRIARVVPGGAAEKAGLRGIMERRVREVGGVQYVLLNREAADRIIAIDKYAVEDTDDVQSVLDRLKPGQSITVTIARDGRQTEVPVVLDAER